MLWDVNQHFSKNDKSGSGHIRWRRGGPLWYTLDHCNFIDMGFSSARYTWSNGREVAAKINEC